LQVDLQVADIEQLPYPDASFDTVTAACVFCSVDDPVRGLREAARVVRPGGQVLLQEHVRPRGQVLGKFTDLISPLTCRLFGPEFNRPTERNVEAAGLRIVAVRRQGILREIVATPHLSRSSQPKHRASTQLGPNSGAFVSEGHGQPITQVPSTEEPKAIGCWANTSVRRPAVA
jgi:SAM-dependent methyltransferase